MNEGDCRLDLELNPENRTDITEVVTEPASPLAPVDYPVDIDYPNGQGPVDYPIDVDYQDSVGEGCSSKCDGVEYDPICGDDGVTYDNTCHMTIASCRSDRGVQIDYYGQCLDREKQCDGPLDWPCKTTQVLSIIIMKGFNGYVRFV